MFALVRRDAAFRMLPKWVILVPLLVMQVEIFRVTLLFKARAFETEVGGAQLALWALIIWIPLALFLGISGAARRSTDLDLALPVPARRLWLTHFAVVFLSALLMLILSVLAISIPSVGFGEWFRRGQAALTGPNALGLIFRIGVGVFVSGVLIQSMDRDLSKIRVTRRYVWVASASLIGVFGLILLLNLLHAGFGLVPLLAAGALAARQVRALPGTLSVAPGRAEALPGALPDESPVERQVSAAGAWGHSLLVLRTALRLYSKKAVTPYLVLPILVGMGVALSGIIYSEEALRYSMVFMTAYVFLIFVSQAIQGMALLDPLPVSRRSLYRMLVLPSLVAVLLGYGAGRVGDGYRDFHGDHVEYRLDRTGRGCCTFVPLSFWRIAWDGQPPATASPWGESRPAWTRPLYRGSRAVLYSPYSTPRGSSRDFVALQLCRAIRDVYDLDLPPEVISKRYLAEDEGGSVIPNPDGPGFLDDHPGLVPVSTGSMFPVILLMIGFAWFIPVSVYLREFRAGVSNRRRKVLVITLAVLCLVLHLLPLPLGELDLASPSVAAAALSIVVCRVAGVLPGGAFAVWALAVLGFAGMYLLGQVQFRRMEVVDAGREAGGCR